MSEIVTPSKFANSVRQGFQRLKTYRKARALFIREYIGQYYRDEQGLTGDEPINLIFHAIRSLVPNLVMQTPSNIVRSKYPNDQDSVQYAELLSLGLNSVERDIKLKDILRAWIVDAIFAFGILKTGLSATGELLDVGNILVDPGQVYTANVDLDNFVFDPVCNKMTESTFFGDKVRVPRQQLLDTDGYDHELVRQLPTSRFNDNGQVEDISRKSTAVSEFYTMQDYVDVVELWVPEAGTIVTIADPEQTIMDDFLRVEDYNGPDSGPYTLLSFTPPVPGNPLPIAPVSIWYDIHKAANKIFQKMMDQSDAQKDLLLYNLQIADEAQDIQDADDGDAVACSDPNMAKVVSFGGQNPINGQMVTTLQSQFNYMAGNPDEMSGNVIGNTGSKQTATRDQIMQSNSAISIEDARDIIYDGTGDVSSKMAWYLHTDPLINLPLTKRKSRNEQIQLQLTPEQKSGDYLDYTFSIKAKSMSKMDPMLRSKRMIEFGTNVVPALINSGMIAMQIGLPFNIQTAITDMAIEYGIEEEVMDWFDDPNFMQRLQIMQQMGPQNPGKAGTGMGGSMAQNGEPPGTRNIPMPQQEMNMQAQETAAVAQSANQGVM